MPPTPMFVRRLAAPVVYRRPVSGLQPVRLYQYLDALYHRRDLEGSVVEIGCHLCGTSAIASKFLAQIDAPKEYLCIDTFGGFVEEHAASDGRLGMRAENRRMFAGNSIELASSLLRRYGAAERVRLRQADISTIDPASLPATISVCLVDVDLEQPVHDALDAVFPRMVPGGVILVDDCPETSSWVGARRGYATWARGRGRPEVYRFGFGVVEVPTSDG